MNSNSGDEPTPPAEAGGEPHRRAAPSAAAEDRGHAAFLAALSRKLAFLSSPAEMVQVASRLVGEHLGADRCYFCEWLEDERRVRVAEDWSAVAGTPSLAGIHDLADFGPADWRLRLATGNFSVADIAADPLAVPFRAAYEALQVRAYATSRFVRQERGTVTVAATMAVPRSWRPDELALLEDVVSRVWPLVERARAQPALAQGEELFRSLADRAPVGIFLCDAHGAAIFVNRGWTAMSGMTAEDALGRGWLGAIHPAERDRVVAQWGAAVRLGQAYEGETRFRRPDGSVVWVLANLLPQRDREGVLTGFIGTTTDLTARRGAERSAQENAEWLNLAFVAAHLGAWSYDLATDELTFSPRAAEIFGVSAERRVLRRDIIERLHEDDRAGVQAANAQAIVGRTDYDMEYRIRRGDEWIWVMAKGRAQYGSDGRPTVMFGVVQDITARKRTEQRDSLIARLTHTLAAAPDEGEIVRVTLRAIASHLGAHRACLLEWADGTVRRTVCGDSRQPAATGSQPDLTLEDFGGGAWERTFSAGNFSVEDVGTHPLTRERLDRYRAVGVGSFAVQPFRAGPARMVVLAVTEPRPRGWRAYDLSLLEAVLGRVWPLVEAARGQAALRRQNDRLLLISDSLARLLNARSPEALLDELLPKVARHLGAEVFFNFLADPAGGLLRLHTFGGLAPEQAGALRQVGYGEGLCGTVARTREPVHLTGLAGEPDPRWGQLREFGLRACACHPLVAGDRLHGTLAFATRTRAAFAAGELEFIRTLSRYIALAIDRARAETALRASELQLRMVMDNAAVFLVHCDRAHRYKFVNRPYAERFGLEPRDIVGRHVRDIVGPEAYELFRPNMDEALAGRRSGFEREVTYRNLGPRWIHVVYEPEHAADGEVIGMVGMITDLTARKTVERETERARDQALAASRAKDDFLAALSHELRTPLNPVLLLASDAADDPALAAEVRERFATIRKNVELEARLIDDLLDLTRITRGSLALDLGRHDVHAILDDAIATVRGELGQKRIVLRLDRQAGGVVAEGDAVRLQQVFWNVLKNAVKFTPEGGTVTLRTRDGGNGWLVVEVADTGIGIAPGEQERIFEAFVQGDRTLGARHRFGGLGLGLAISRKLVELHGGRIHASSGGIGRGATFVIELPRRRERGERGAREPGQTDGAAGTRSSPGAGLRLLLVEDHEPTRRALTHLLGRRKFQVSAAASLAEARAHAAREQFSVLISDIELPDGNGYDLMRELRAAHGLKGIALTGHGMEADVGLSREAGFAIHLTKPVSVQSLDAALASVINGTAA